MDSSFDSHFRQQEHAALETSNALNISLLRSFGVGDKFLTGWQHGVELVGHENAPAYQLEDYPSVRNNPHTAAEEIDRLAAEDRIRWYSGTIPHDLDVGPTTLVEKSARSRLVHDWTRARLNQYLAVPSITFADVGSLISALWPGCHMAGLDIRG